MSTKQPNPTPTTDPPSTLRAMIYRGKQASENCPESVAQLLKSAYPNIQITFAGPDEAVEINEETLARVDVFAQPGGPGKSSSHIISHHPSLSSQRTLTY